jgi:hypothetical protein
MSARIFERKDVANGTGETAIAPLYSSGVCGLQIAEVRHEFFEGEIFAMSGGSIRRNVLIGNCVFALKTGLRGKKCQVFFENVQLAVEKGTIITLMLLWHVCQLTYRQSVLSNRQCY